MSVADQPGRQLQCWGCVRQRVTKLMQDGGALQEGEVATVEASEQSQHELRAGYVDAQLQAEAGNGRQATPPAAEHVIAAEDKVGWSEYCTACTMLVSCRQAARLSGRQLHHKQGRGFRHRNVRKQGGTVMGGCSIAVQSEQGMHNMSSL